MSHDQQLSLPYEVITKDKLANRDYLRKNFSRGKETYLIPVSSLVIRDGFNKRIVYEGLEELAESIKENGIKEPLVVDVLADGRCVIDRGHRRYKAIQLLLSKGEKIDTVECFINGRDVTEQQRMEDIFNSNMFSSKLNPVEQANTVFALKKNFGKISNEEIAKRIGVSRQQVDNLLILAGADDLTKQEIIKGNLNISDAIKSIRNSKKAQEDADQKELDANKTSASPALQEPDPLAADLKELKELEESGALTEEELQERELQRIAKEEKEREAIIAISDEIKVRPDTLPEHLGRKLSMPVMRTWVEDFVDEGNGEVVSIERSQVVIPKNEVVDDAMVETILAMEEAVDTIFVYQKGKEPVAKSVITVEPGEEEKGRYDESRPEIAAINNCITLCDRLEVITSKFDIPDGSKKDVADIIKWMMKDLEISREYIHVNKKQNKRGS